MPMAVTPPAMKAAVYQSFHAVLVCGLCVAATVGGGGSGTGAAGGGGEGGGGRFGKNFSFSRKIE